MSSSQQQAQTTPTEAPDTTATQQNGNGGTNVAQPTAPENAQPQTVYGETMQRYIKQQPHEEPWNPVSRGGNYGQ